MFESKFSFGTVSQIVAILLFAGASAGAANLSFKLQPASATQERKSDVKPKPKIKTSKGDFEIEEVQESDRFPPDCQNPPSPGCDKAREGYKILIVWLKSAGEGRVDMELFDLSKGVYVTADDDSKTERFSGGGIHQKTADGGFEGKLFVGFTPAKTARNFKLYWPGNSPIELSHIERVDSAPKN